MNTEQKHTSDPWIERDITIAVGPHVNRLRISCNSETIYLENIGHTPPVCMFIGTDAELRREKPDLYRRLQEATR